MIVESGFKCVGGKADMATTKKLYVRRYNDTAIHGAGAGAGMQIIAFNHHGRHQ